MEWLDIHKQDKITDEMLTERQAKWFAIASTLDRPTMLLLISGFDMDKLQKYKHFAHNSEFAEVLDLMFDEPTNEFANAIMMADKFAGVDFEKLSLADMNIISQGGHLE